MTALRLQGDISHIRLPETLDLTCVRSSISSSPRTSRGKPVQLSAGKAASAGCQCHRLLAVPHPPFATAGMPNGRRLVSRTGRRAREIRLPGGLQTHRHVALKSTSSWSSMLFLNASDQLYPQSIRAYSIMQVPISFTTTWVNTPPSLGRRPSHFCSSPSACCLHPSPKLAAVPWNVISSTPTCCPRDGVAMPFLLGLGGPCA